MPVPTIIPTGVQGIAELGLAYLVASTAQFQTLTNTSTALAALAFVHCESDDTANMTAIRPRAMIHMSDKYTEESESLVTFNKNPVLWLTFEFPVTAKYIGNLWNERIEFMNRVDTILGQMRALNGQGTGYPSMTSGGFQLAHTPILSMELSGGPTRVADANGIGSEEELQLFYGVTYAVTTYG